MMSGSLRRHRHKDKDEDATAFARGGPFDYSAEYGDDEQSKTLQPVAEDEGDGLGRAPSFIQRLRGTASGAMMRIRSPYENLERPDPALAAPRGLAGDSGYNAPRSSTAYLAAAAQREFLASEGGGAIAPDDERLLALRAAFVAANGPIPADMDAVFSEYDILW